MTPAEAPDATPIRVLLADDHPVVRRGLAALLATLDGIEVVAQAGTGDDAVREVGFSRPDVVVMDLRMPGVDGVEATRRIVKGYPKTAVLVLTMFDEDALVADALRAGARGYLLKRAEQAEIERAIRAVAAGDAIFSSEVAGRVLGAITVGSRSSSAGSAVAAGTRGARHRRHGGDELGDRPSARALAEDRGQSHLRDLSEAGCCHPRRGRRDRQGRRIGPP